MSFAENLKAVRKEKNISQEQLAEMLNVSRQSVSKWESATGYPETEKLIVLANRLEVSLDYLLLDKAVCMDKICSENKKIPSDKIFIRSYDKKTLVNCLKVKSYRIPFAGKKDCKYWLGATDHTSFLGDNNDILGYYATEEDIIKEIDEISKAMLDGETSYELKYSKDFIVKGFLINCKILFSVDS